MNFVFILNSAALGVGLAMDAFSVSLANGLHEPRMRHGRMALIAGVYALFQYAMPMIGWGCVRTVAEKLVSFQKLVPYIALVLLLYIGGKMLIEGIRERKEEGETESGRVLRFRDLLIQGIATSIDALSVGFTIEKYNLVMANAASMIIGAVTFVICVAGLALGKKAGTHLSWKASVLGGCILIAIGVEIFVTG